MALYKSVYYYYYYYYYHQTFGASSTEHGVDLSIGEHRQRGIDSALDGILGRAYRQHRTGHHAAHTVYIHIINVKKLNSLNMVSEAKSHV